MNKTERHLQIIQIIRNRRLTTAAHLSERLEVSLRTIYRDIQSISLSGIPVYGEAGTGYRMDDEFNFPPLMFTETEVRALVFGMQLVKQTSDSSLQEAAAEVIKKVEKGLKTSLKSVIDSRSLFVPMPMLNRKQMKLMAKLRKATDNCFKAKLNYVDESDKSSSRTVRPLGLLFWGKVWTLVAWCELREDFRHFRLDRMQSVVLSERKFEIEAGKSLADFERIINPGHRA